MEDYAAETGGRPWVDYSKDHLDTLDSISSDEHCRRNIARCPGSLLYRYTQLFHDSGSYSLIASGGRYATTSQHTRQRSSSCGATRVARMVRLGWCLLRNMSYDNKNVIGGHQSGISPEKPHFPSLRVVISSMDWILRSNPYPLQFLKADPYPMDLTTAKSIIAGYIAG
jgi:hypothetical protein